MSIKGKLRQALLIVAVGFALLGVPIMSPQQTEDLLRHVSVPKVAETRREDDDSGDDLEKD